MIEDAEDVVKRLTGLPVPEIALPWTAYADHHDLLRPAASMSLADLAKRDMLVAYFFPAEDEEDGPSVNTVSRAYRSSYHEISRLGARIVGISTQAASRQRQIALTELFPQLLLADDELWLAEALWLPTTEVADRYEYEPMTLLVRDGLIAQVIYPIASPRAHIAQVLGWLQEEGGAS
jgi:peroxiredoxin